MTVHIIGGGLAGLAAALKCSERGERVKIYESAPMLGGRCRTFFDPTLGCDIDNGTHVVMPANRAVMTYLGMIGARETLIAQPSDRIEMFDMLTERVIALRPSSVWNPFWLFMNDRRPPSVSAMDLIAGFMLAWANPRQTADTALQSSAAAKYQLWDPFCTAVLNARLGQADARLFGKSVASLLASWHGPPIPHFADETLAASFIRPAVRLLGSRNAEIALTAPVTGMKIANGRVSEISVNDMAQPVAAGDRVISTVPPWTPLIAPYLPESMRSWPVSAIVNVHYKVAHELPGQFKGVLGSSGQWILVRRGIVSVTASAAGRWLETSAEEIGTVWWPGVAAALGLPADAVPKFRVVKERRATLMHGPGIDAARASLPKIATNFAVAGDWIRPGLPCSLEAAVQSGFAAASASNA
ncbi:MAG: FAD-dependent oxidoreductase [Rhodobacteraceae bacterium]|nr:FAD-dependent oxidoreductase [Paracoccaceae bacterium]